MGLFYWNFRAKNIKVTFTHFCWDNLTLFSTTVITSWCFKLISPFKSSNNVSFSFMMHFLRGSKSKTWCSCMLSGRIEYEFSRLLFCQPIFAQLLFKTWRHLPHVFCKVVSTNVIYEGKMCNSFLVEIYRFSFWIFTPNLLFELNWLWSFLDLRNGLKK